MQTIAVQDANILSEEEACINLKALRNINKRIPQTEYEKRIKNWCK
jgi:hypothetical protein